MNNKYIIKAKHPLIRAGLEIETEASEKYVQVVIEKLLDIIRALNKAELSERNRNEDEKNRGNRGWT